MSRHRFVRNLNIHDELDDEPLSDGGDDGMTTEQHAQMEEALAQVRELMGDQSVSRLDDQIIRDTLWECYFDVEQAIPWLYEEQERRAAADERKDGPLKDLPPVPADRDSFSSGDSADFPEYPPNQHYYNYGGVLDHPRIPLIVLAQQGHYIPSFQPTYASESDSNAARSRLSTITERTEHSEHPHRRSTSRQQLSVNAGYNPRSSTASSSSYGQLLPNGTLNYGRLDGPADPNFIPPSPSRSAVNRLSIDDDGAPSRTESESASETSTVRANRVRSPPVVVPAVGDMPDIPDYATSKSKSSRVHAVSPGPGALQRPVNPQPPAQLSRSASSASARSSNTSVPGSGAGGKGPSKLARLASARSRMSASSVSTDVSALETETAATYPALRPAADSRYSLAYSLAGGVSVDRPISEVSEAQTTSSHMSAHVRRALETALELEAADRRERERAGAAGAFYDVDKSLPRTPATTHTELTRGVSMGGDEDDPSEAGSKTPTMATREELTRDMDMGIGVAPSETESTDPNLLLMTPKSLLQSSTMSDATVSRGQGRAPSKLAMLAQAKARNAATATRTADAPTPDLPRARTQYLTPIANGPTATTAITTSYQTLRSIASSPPEGSRVSLVGLPSPTSGHGQRDDDPFASSSSPPRAGRPSKLAMKISKAREKYLPTPTPAADSAETSLLGTYADDVPRAGQGQGQGYDFAPPSPLFAVHTGAGAPRASPSAFAAALLYGADHDVLTPGDDPQGQGPTQVSPRSPRSPGARYFDTASREQPPVHGPSHDLSQLPDRVPQSLHGAGASAPRGLTRSVSDASGVSGGGNGNSGGGSPTKRRDKAEKARKITPTLGARPRSGFAFDTPSPDDIVFSARRGTSLAQRL